MSELEKRITAALVDATTSAELAALIEATETAIVTADAAADAERERALDPLVSPDAGKARAAMDHAAFTRDRLHTVLPRLKQRLQKVQAAEYAARWQADYERVQAKRDVLAAEYAQLYPKLVSQITDLFGRAAECDRNVARINGSAPRGEHRRLREVELMARNLERFTRDEPSITKELKLPDWDQPTKLAWPPHRPSNWSSVTPAMHHPGADWHSEIEARNLARRQESERVAAFYEAQQRA
jgi:hypothetical protein